MAVQNSINGTFLQQRVASTSASVAFTNIPSGDNKLFTLMFTGVFMGTNAAFPTIQFSANSGILRSGGANANAIHALANTGNVKKTFRLYSVV